MPKKFLVNVIILLTANLFIKPFWIFGIDLTIQNKLGNALYGEYIHLFTISLFFSMILDFGINNYTSSLVAKNPNKLGSNLGMVMPAKMLLSSIYLAVTLGFGWFNQLNKHAMLMLLCLCLNQVLAYFTLFFRANIAGLQWFKTDALLSIADRLAMIFFAIMLFYFNPNAITIWGFILTQTFGFIAAFILSATLVFKQGKDLVLKFNRVFIINTFKQSWSYALLVLTMTLYMRIDYLLIKKYLPNGDSENGIYALANRLFDAANMFAVLVSGMLLPIFAKLIDQKTALIQLIKTALVLLLIPAGVVAAISWFYAPQIMGLINNESAAQSAVIFHWVMLAFFFLCMMYVFGTLLTAGGNLFELNKWAAFALIINLFVNAWLIPKYGALGAAITALITHAFVALTNTWKAFVIYKLAELKVYFVKIMSVVIFAFLVSWFCVAFKASLFWALGIVTGFTVLFTFFLRLLQVNWVLTLLRQKEASV